MSWYDELREVVTLALDPHAPRIPNDGCRYCQANLICPERQEGVKQSLSNLFQPVTEEPVAKTTLPPPISVTDDIANLAEARLTQDASTLTDGDLGRLLDMEALITGYFRDVKAEALKRAKAGHNPSGWKLIAGRRSREWTVAEEDLPAKLKALRVSAADMWVKKIISPAQAEKLEVISASKKRREALDELWKWKEGGPQLAPESDPSPEWRAPEKLFAPVAEPEAELELPSWY